MADYAERVRRVTGHSREEWIGRICERREVGKEGRNLRKKAGLLSRRISRAEISSFFLNTNTHQTAHLLKDNIYIYMEDHGYSSLASTYAWTSI